jgi:RNA polymerase sigma-70 factor (ECF subfamily)
MVNECIVETEAPQPVAVAPDFARLVEQEIPFLRRLVRRWRSTTSEADDLVQDTLVRALASGHLFEPGTNLRAWLVVIMRNQFLTSLARSKRHESALSAYAVANPGATSHGGEARLVLRDVEDALRHLPEKQRSALLMVSLDGQSYEEVSQSIGRSVAAIRCDLARARDRLRQAVNLGEARTPWATALQRAGSVTPKRAQGKEPPPVKLRRPLPYQAALSS